MADEIEFVNGLIVKAPHENAPDFVKCAISIKREELIEWLQGRDEEWLNIDVKESKAGKWYASVSTFKPKSRDAAPVTEHSAAKADGFQPQGGGGFEDDIPFAPIGRGAACHVI